MTPEKRSPREAGILRKLAGWALRNFNQADELAVLLVVLVLLAWGALR